MTRQIVTTTPHNSGLGDAAFTAFEKVNANEAELYAAAGVTGASALSAATYAAARLLTGTTTGDRLQVLGRTTQSDGGQGLFTWVAGGSTSINDGTELTATGGIWKRTPDQLTNPRMFGAVGDGVVDDKVAIQAAANTGYCYLSPGYIFGTSVQISVPINGTFIGAGMGLSTIKGLAVSGPVVVTATGAGGGYQTIGNFKISGTGKTALSVLMPISNFYNILVSGTFSFNAFSFDLAFGGALTNLVVQDAVIGSTLTFTGSVGGATSGTISSGTNPGDSLYIMVFSNGEVRAVTISGSAASWALALKTGTITTVAYGADFYLGGAFNAVVCNGLYSGGGFVPFNFIFDDVNGVGGSSGSTINNPTAQGGQVGVFFGLNHSGHTLNSLYTESVVTPIIYGLIAGGTRVPQSITFNSPSLGGPFASNPGYASRYTWIDLQFGRGLKITNPRFFVEDGSSTTAYPLTFTGGTATQAALAYAFANAAGVIKGVALIYGGNYSVVPTGCSYTGGNPGSGATFSLTTGTVPIRGDQGVLTVSVTAGGNGYTASTGMVPVLINQAQTVSIDTPSYGWGGSNNSWGGISPILAYSSINPSGDASRGITITGEVGQYTTSGSGEYGAPFMTVYKAYEYTYQHWVEWDGANGAKNRYSVPMVAFP